LIEVKENWGHQGGKTMLNHRMTIFALVFAAALVIAATLELPAIAQQKADTRDEFFWLGQINKATAVINTDEGLLDKAIAPAIAAGVAKVIEDGPPG
jgi:fumarate hydratase class II